ncbi:MAG: YdeI/OmpD-associated family protein [Verrucomicrobiota bacterium]
MFRRRPYEYQFRGTVSEYDFGTMAYRVVYLPKDLIQKLPLDNYPRLRIDAMIEDVPHHGAVQPSSKGPYLLLSKRLLKDIGKSHGDPIEISFDIADQDAVDVPPELELALARTPHLQKKWDSLTPGKRRSFAFRVSKAKRPETKNARVEEVLDLLGDL